MGGTIERKRTIIMKANNGIRMNSGPINFCRWIVALQCFQQVLLQIQSFVVVRHPSSTTMRRNAIAATYRYYDDEWRRSSIKRATTKTTALYAERSSENRITEVDGDDKDADVVERISDPPLVSYMEDTDELIKDFTLAETCEDYIELKPNQRLVCIGDVHGDYDALVKFLELGGVYDSETNRWCGNDTIVVQCGDVLDRGYQELKSFQLLAKLSHEAVKDDGKVICLLGNHEVLNAMGLFQYALSDIEYEQLVGEALDSKLNTTDWRLQYVNNQPSRWTTYEPNGLFSKRLLANMKVAIQIGQTVCVHAGLTKEQLMDNGGISGMNQAAKEWFLFNDEKYKHNVTYNNRGNYPSFQQTLVAATNRQESYINTIPEFLNGGIGVSSPVWMRDYSNPNDRPPKNPTKTQKMIDECLSSLDHPCVRMVMGHTVQKQINSALGGKAWRIDVGASRGVVGGTPEVLEIINQPIITKTTKKRRKKQRRTNEKGDDSRNNNDDDDQVVVETTTEEVVSILTPNEGKIPSKEREAFSVIDMFF